MRVVDLDTFAAAPADGPRVIDVREAAESTREHAPGAVLMSRRVVAARVTDVPRKRPVDLICTTGRRGFDAAGIPAGAGIDAYVVAGGAAAWRRAGLVVISGMCT